MQKGKEKVKVKMRSGQGRLGGGNTQNPEVPGLAKTYPGASSMWEGEAGKENTSAPFRLGA